MKNILLLLLTILISSCNDNYIEETTKTYDNGKPEIIKYYKEIGQGKELVKRVEFWENGKIFIESHYRDGKLNGPNLAYFETGEIMWKGTHLDGESDGLHIEYHPNGQISWEGSYKKGFKLGEWIAYYESGQIWQKINWNNYGTWDRIQKKYNEDGTIQGEYTWVDGEIIKSKEY